MLGRAWERARDSMQEHKIHYTRLACDIQLGRLYMVVDDQVARILQIDGDRGACGSAGALLRAHVEPQLMEKYKVWDYA